MMFISSLKNQRIKEVVKLRDRRHRDRQQKVLIEGYRELLRATENDYPVDTVFVCHELFQGKNEPALIELLREKGVELFETSEFVFQKMAYRDRPEGLIGVGPQIHHNLDNLDLGDVPLLLVAEAVEKPGNLGTILRSADAAGVTGCIVCDSCTDLFNPNVVRASIGTLFTVPLAEASSTETVEWLQSHNVTVLAATPHTDYLYTEADLTGPLAIVVGTEQYGLSEKWLQGPCVKVRIPMLGQADSLNVSTATALLLYEAVRQRSCKLKSGC